MWTARSIPKQLKNKKKTSILQLLLSPCSSVKLFNTTPQPSFEKGPSFVGCLRKTLIPQHSSFFSPSSQLTSFPMSLHKIKSPFFSSSQLTSSMSPSLHKIPFFSSSSSHGGSGSYSSLTIIRGISSSCYSEVDDNITIAINKEDQIASIPIRAYFFSTSIDLKSLLAENQVNFIPPTLPVTNHIVLRFSDTNSRPHVTDVEASLSGSSYSYLVVFQYGSVVTFNIVDREVDRYLKIIERHASGLLPEMRKDNEVFRQNEIKYEVVEKRNLPMWMKGGLDYIMIQDLNIDGIRMISSALGVSGALDYYVRQVDEFVARYTEVNLGMEKTGTYANWRKIRKLQEEVNKKVPDIIVKVRQFKRSEIAWEEHEKYGQMWEYLQKNFELTQRLVGLDFKLRLLKLNINFYIDALWRRIYLISHTLFECVIFLPLAGLALHWSSAVTLLEAILRWLQHPGPY